MKSVVQITISALLLGLILAACAPAVPVTGVGNSPTVGPAQATTRPAPIESVEIQIAQGSPVQVTALVRGHLTESCATLGDSRVVFASNVFQISVVAVSPNDRGCIQIVTPFETTISLDTSNLPAGTYTATANGVSAVFTLSADNAAPTAIPTAAPTTAACTDAATFVSDVTIPDGTVVPSNTAFTKTWKLKNSGSCTWDSRYLVSYIWGTGTTMIQQPSYSIIQQGQAIAPGQTVNVSVALTSPVQNGNHAAYWGLKRENASLMPVAGGANGNSFYVKIKVNDGSRAPAGNVTNASIDIDLEQGSGAICTPDSTYLVHAHITADGPTTASYEIDSSAGQISAGYFESPGGAAPSPAVTGTMTFAQADTKTINLRFVGPYPYPDNIAILLRVNSGEWHNAKVMCP
jgi:Ig-like domain-containing protein